MTRGQKSSLGDEGKDSSPGDQRPRTRDHEFCTSQGLGAQEAAVGRNTTVFNFFVSLHEN